MKYDDLLEIDIKEFLVAEKVTCGFWEQLATELKTQIYNRNVALRLDRLQLRLTEETDSSIRIAFLQHELRVMVDMRTGLVRYAYVSPELKFISQDLSEITHSSYLQLDPKSSPFIAVAAPDFPDLCFLNESEGRDRPLCQRFGALLIDKLITPTDDQ